MYHKTNISSQLLKKLVGSKSNYHKLSVWFRQNRLREQVQDNRRVNKIDRSN